MKVRRQKKVKKTLSYYQNNFGFHKPFNILIDGTFCRAALQEKVNIREQLSKYFSADVNIVTTQCIILEVEKLSKIIKKLHGSWVIIKQFPTHQCGHKRKAQSATDCIKSMLVENNPNRYIVATMDNDLRKYINSSVVAAPILYLHGHTPVLEKPSLITEQCVEAKSMSMSLHELQTLRELKSKIIGEPEQTPIKKKKKKNKNLKPSHLKGKKHEICHSTEEPPRKKVKRNDKKEDIYISIKKAFSTS